MQNGNKTPKDITISHLFFCGSYVRSSVNSRLPEDEIAECCDYSRTSTKRANSEQRPLFLSDTPYIALFSNLSTTVTFFCPPRWPLPRGSTVKINESKKKIRKTYCSMGAMYFYRSICKKKKMCLYPETVTKNRPKFRRKSTGSQGSKLVMK